MSRPAQLMIVAAAALTSALLVVPSASLAAPDSWTTVNYNRMPVVVGSGRVVRQQRPVSRFNGIETLGSEVVEVRVGAAPSLVIAADDNILPLIRSEVRNGTLKIESRGSYRIRGPIRVWITTPDLQSFKTMGSGDVTIQGVNNRRLALALHGSGDIRASGRTGHLDVDIYGSGNAQLAGLAANDADASVFGSGNASVRASGRLQVSVFGSGNVHYVGRPVGLRTQRMGSGQVSAR